MLVLVALVFLLARLLPHHDPVPTESEPPAQVDRATLVADLVRAVPWLGSLGNHKGSDHDPR
jgi:hypothetical protein